MKRKGFDIKLEYLDDSHILCKVYKNKKLVHKDVIEYYDYNTVDDDIDRILSMLCRNESNQHRTGVVLLNR